LCDIFLQVMLSLCFRGGGDGGLHVIIGLKKVKRCGCEVEERKGDNDRHDEKR
jgi:hypothetical protein